MGDKANAYAYSIIGVGTAVVLDSLHGWMCADGGRFMAYALLAVFAGMLRVDLPGRTGAFSLSFLLVLMSIADLSGPEAVVIAAFSALGQCVYRADPQPGATEILFHAGQSSMAASLCWSITRSGAIALLRHNVPAQLALTACVYFGAQMLLVSPLIAILNSEALQAVCQRWFLWSFPYYAAGSLLASFVVACGKTIGWAPALLALPVMILVFAYYRTVIVMHPHTVSTGLKSDAPCV